MDFKYEIALWIYTQKYECNLVKPVIWFIENLSVYEIYYMSPA